MQKHEERGGMIGMSEKQGGASVVRAAYSRDRVFVTRPARSVELEHVEPHALSHGLWLLFRVRQQGRHGRPLKCRGVSGPVRTWRGFRDRKLCFWLEQKGRAGARSPGPLRSQQQAWTSSPYDRDSKGCKQGRSHFFLLERSPGCSARYWIWGWG